MPVVPPEILGRLYREHAPALRLYARQWPGGDEDLVQEAFVKLAQQSPPPDQVLPWLYRVIRNGALSLERKGMRRRKRENYVSTQEAWFSSDDDRIDAQEVARLLGELPLEQREIIVARLWGGLTFEEIARLTGCPLATAHRWYKAGLENLREKLQKCLTYPIPKS